MGRACGTYEEENIYIAGFGGENSRKEIAWNIEAWICGCCYILC
jgi:hypothetical protein